ncbi:MAG TPA: flagellar hook-length control protein FliK [Pyrinomonadaceae bacterium]|nr:flagellar hook-length control protein FliK [Pyrinomonadaceae bacterium]
MTNLVTTNSLALTAEAGPSASTPLDDVLADEFASMFASFCVMSMPSMPTPPPVAGEEVETPAISETPSLSLEAAPTIEIEPEVLPVMVGAPAGGTEPEQFDIPLPPAPPLSEEAKMIDQVIETRVVHTDPVQIASDLALAIERNFERTTSNPVKGLLNNFVSSSNSEKQQGDREGLVINQTGIETSIFTSSRPIDNPRSIVSIKSQTLDQIVALAAMTNAAETKSIRFRLRPKELGQIEIQLTRDAEGRLSANLNVERESARTLLSQTLGELRESLTRAGFTVDKIEIRAETGLLGGNAEGRGASNHSNETVFATPDKTESVVNTKPEEEKLVSLRA